MNSCMPDNKNHNRKKCVHEIWRRMEWLYLAWDPFSKRRIIEFLELIQWAWNQGKYAFNCNLITTNYSACQYLGFCFSYTCHCISNTSLNWNEMKEKKNDMSVLLTLVASCKPASNRIGPADVSKAVRTADTSWAYIHKISVNWDSWIPEVYNYIHTKKKKKTWLTYLILFK